MLPIIDFPDVVKEYAGSFRHVFSYHQFHRFKQYISGIITSDRVTVSAITSRLVERSNQSSMNRFLTWYEWSEEHLNNERLRLLQEGERTRWHRRGIVSIDDVLIHKTGKKMPGAGKLYDHTENRHAHAQCLVTSHYADKTKDYPINYRQYFKWDSKEARQYGFKTKIQLAKELVDDCESKGVLATVYTFDSWFLSKELTDHIRSYGKDWVSRLKSNRILYLRGRMNIKEFEATIPRKAFREIEVRGKAYWVFTKTLHINKLGRARIVISYDNERLEGDPVYLATNRTNWEAKKVLICYLLRSSIDAFYRDAKQNLGFGKCQLRSIKGTRRHWSLGILAYTLLKLRICKSRLYRRIESDQTIGGQCRQAFKDMLGSIVMWVHKNILKGIPMNKILEVLLT